jgi:hypothetical protein
MAVIGLVMLVLSEALGFGAMWTIVGMLLLVAGLVKVVMVHIWQNIAGFGSPPVPRDDT